ncbi:hypothetical protein KIN20_008946 [Parelaphostrongylus tenuis]|uniref:Uncharacterized protein n=1 Tax=Parelaphostrongylus tenuis TaxID=148309 RepID=A0AAD5MR41_PARTN|nr:hypothetical protein KIN20_008946 [Parelaphostrongylus tenuis]
MRRPLKATLFTGHELLKGVLVTIRKSRKVVAATWTVGCCHNAVAAIARKCRFGNLAKTAENVEKSRVLGADQGPHAGSQFCRGLVDFHVLSSDVNAIAYSTSEDSPRPQNRDFRNIFCTCQFDLVIIPVSSQCIGIQDTLMATIR